MDLPSSLVETFMNSAVSCLDTLEGVDWREVGAAVDKRVVDTRVDVRTGVPLVDLLAGVEGPFGEATGVF